MAQTTSCPDRELLARFLSGQLSAAERPALEQHLARCTKCLAAVQTLRSDDALLQTFVGDGSNQVGDGTMAADLSTELRKPVARPPAHAFLAPPQQPDEIGRLAHYRVLKQLGAGGMGMVFLAEDTGLDRPVALKVMLPEAAATKDAGPRFLREAKLTASIKNDHIVTIYQVGQHGLVPFLAMELLSGSSLDDRLKTTPQLPIPQLLRIGREIALGLEVAHARGLIHRDIKPANVWLEAPNDRVKILDFGLARQASGGENLTQSGAILGTPAYMAPEQAEGLAVDGRADLFSLGCVLYRLCTGQMPFSGPTIMSILRALATVTPPSVSKLRPDVPPALVDLIDRLLAKDPTGRPASARAVIDELAAMEAAVNPCRAAVETMHMPRQGETKRQGAGPEPTTRLLPARGSRRLWPWVAAALLLLGAGSLVAWKLVPGPSPPDTVTGTTKGKLVIEADDPEAEIVVKKNGAVVIDKTVQREIELEAGDYEIALAEGNEGLKLSTDKVHIARDGRETVKVSFDESPEVKPAEAEFVPLFNGKDLTGWKTHPDQPGGWKVEDGCLVGRSKTANHLFSERGDYENFHVRAEVQINKFGNSGIFFRTSFGLDLGGKYPAGYEAQTLNDYPRPNSPLTGSLMPHLVVVDKPFLKPDEWFTMDVIAEGNHIRIKINGATTADFVDKANTYRKGHFALQAMSDNVVNTTTVVRFRKIEVKELPAPEPGFEPLFNGTDLTGWKTHPTDNTKWEVQDGILVSSHKSASGASLLFSERDNFRNFHLRIEAMYNSIAAGGVFFRSKFEKGIPPGYEAIINSVYRLPKTGSLDPSFNRDFSEEERRKLSMKMSPHKPNEWFTMEIIADGNHLVIKVNGKVKVDFVDEKNTYSMGRIAIGYRHDKALIRVRKIELKELP